VLGHTEYVCNIGEDINSIMATVYTYGCCSLEADLVICSYLYQGELRGVYTEHKFCVVQQNLLLYDTSRTTSISLILSHDKKCVFCVNRPYVGKSTGGM
jgi:hypothetical protein